MWKGHRGRNGLYMRNMDVTPGAVALSLDGLYYFGDIEAPGAFAAFKDFTPDNMSFSGTLSYLQPVHKMVKMRYGVGGGLLRAEDARKRSFDSWFFKPALGVEAHLVPLYDFYFYGGVAFNCGFVDFNYGGVTNGDSRYVTLNPQFSLELGYNFPLSRSWLIGVHLGSDFNVIDAAHMSLDGRPSVESNPKKPALGSRWADGYVYLGLTVTYDWSNGSQGGRR